MGNLMLVCASEYPLVVVGSVSGWPDLVNCRVVCGMLWSVPTQSGLFYTLIRYDYCTDDNIILFTCIVYPNIVLPVWSVATLDVA